MFGGSTFGKIAEQNKKEKPFEFIVFQCSSTKAHQVILPKDKANELADNGDIICKRCLVPWEFGETKPYGSESKLEIDVDETIRQNEDG